MRIYPLIYSRTKFVGYISSFLVRPVDIDYAKAVRYASIAIENINYTDGVRYATFSAGEYVIYHGLACYVPRLVEHLNNQLDGIDYQDYQTDNAGRPLPFFIGFAVKRSEYNGNVPNIDLLTAYQIYLEYLKHQFYADVTDTEITEGFDLNPDTETEIIGGIKLKEIPCTSDFIPEVATVDRLSILKNGSTENARNIMNYYFQQIINNPAKEISFVSDLLPDDVKLSLPYVNLTISEGSVENCVARLKQKKVQSVRETKPIQVKQPETVSQNKKPDQVRRPPEFYPDEKKNYYAPQLDYPNSNNFIDYLADYIIQFLRKVPENAFADIRYQFALKLFPEFKQLNRLRILLKLLDGPDNFDKSDFADLAKLAKLSKFEGLEKLKYLKQLEKLKKQR